METDQNNISELKGLDQKSEKILANAGIIRVQQICEYGSISCYVMTKHANKNVSLILLWALESTITGEHWQQVAKNNHISL
ncbi:MAG: hypothetical protein ACI9XC_001216 [Gammaproteobacteria bacterium]|jgi:hypothetical protein